MSSTSTGSSGRSIGVGSGLVQKRPPEQWWLGTSIHWKPEAHGRKIGLHYAAIAREQELNYVSSDK